MAADDRILVIRRFNPVSVASRQSLRRVVQMIL